MNRIGVGRTYFEVGLAPASPYFYMVPICLACEYWDDEYNFFCTNCKHCTTKMIYKNETWKKPKEIEIEVSL